MSKRKYASWEIAMMKGKVAKAKGIKNDLVAGDQNIEGVSQKTKVPVQPEDLRPLGFSFSAERTATGSEENINIRR